MENKSLKVLSASRIKTLETCSWVYWNNYHTKVPQSQNDGALRGTICHTIFELLLNPKHKAHYDKIIKKNSVKGSKAIARLIKKLKAKVGLDESNFEILDQMIMVGLKHDFFGEKDGEIVSPEYAFEIEANIQAMMYSLASKKLWPKLKPIVRFLFLRFPKQPIQELQFTEDQIKGFEYYLEHINDYINKFDENSAKANFAIDSDKSKWMCGIGNWRCPYRDPYEYYVKLNTNNDIIETSIDGKFKDITGFKVEKRKYTGCPKFNLQKTNDEFLD
jgi:hypothetical protein